MEKVENTQNDEVTSQVNLEERGIIIEKEDKQKLESMIEDMRNFLKENSDVSKMSSQEKDDKYKEITEKWNVFQTTLRGVEYNYLTTKKEYKWFRGLIYNEMSYGPNEIFVAMRVKEKFFSVGDKAFNSGKIEKTSFKVKIDDLTIAYHLIESYKHKGLGETSYYFANTLKTIGDISIIFNSFDKTSKQLSEEIGNWCGGLDAETPAEGPSIEAAPVPETEVGA